MSKDPEDVKDEWYSLGERRAWLTMLAECLHILGYEDKEAARVARVAWVREREAAVQALRSLCMEFGDTDWDEQLNLEDVINKHLGDHLRQG